MLNGLYAPALQPDYGGSVFAHIRAMLRAQPVYNQANELIKPWAIATELRPGTLIMFEATFHCYKYERRKVRSASLLAMKRKTRLTVNRYISSISYP